MAKRSKVSGTGMFPMPSKKDKDERPERKQKHKKPHDVDQDKQITDEKSHE